MHNVTIKYILSLSFGIDLSSLLFLIILQEAAREGKVPVQEYLVEIVRHEA